MLARDRYRGMTLVELLVAVAVIAILSSLAVPSFVSMIENRRLKLVADTVISDMREAHSVAKELGAGGSVVMEFLSPGSGWSYTVTQTTLGDLASRSASDFGGFVALSVTGSDFADADSDGNRDLSMTYAAQFDADDTGTVTLTYSTKSVLITRNLGGLLSACASDSAVGFDECAN